MRGVAGGRTGWPALCPAGRLAPSGQLLRPRFGDPQLVGDLLQGEFLGHVGGDDFARDLSQSGLCGAAGLQQSIDRGHPLCGVGDGTHLVERAGHGPLIASHRVVAHGVEYRGDLTRYSPPYTIVV